MQYAKVHMYLKQYFDTYTCYLQNMQTIHSKSSFNKKFFTLLPFTLEIKKICYLQNMQTIHSKSSFNKKLFTLLPFTLEIKNLLISLMQE